MSDYVQSFSLPQTSVPFFLNKARNGEVTQFHLILAELLDLDAVTRLSVYNTRQTEIKIPAPNIIWLVKNSQIFDINFDILQTWPLSFQCLFFHFLFRCQHCRQRPCVLQQTGISTSVKQPRDDVSVQPAQPATFTL